MVLVCSLLSTLACLRRGKVAQARPSTAHAPICWQPLSAPASLLLAGEQHTPGLQPVIHLFHVCCAVVYDYAQSVEEVLIEAQLPAHIQRHDVAVKLEPAALLVTVGQQCVIDGCLAGRILLQHSSWKIGASWKLLCCTGSWFSSVGHVGATSWPVKKLGAIVTKPARMLPTSGKQCQQRCQLLGGL